MESSDGKQIVLEFETGFRPMSQTEVADLFGVSRQYIHEVERLALRKLRIELERQGVVFEDFVRVGHERHN